MPSDTEPFEKAFVPKCEYAKNKFCPDSLFLPPPFSPSVRIISRFLAILFLTSCLTMTVAASDIDLRNSKIAPETEKVPGGAKVTVNVVLKNTGDKPSDGTDLTIGFPQNGFIIRIDGLPEFKRNDEEREVTARVNIPAGEEFRFSFDLLASRSEVSNFLSTHIEVRNLLAKDLAAARWNSDVSIKITSAPTKSQFVIGGVRINPPPIGLAVWMVSTVVMFVWLRSRIKWSQVATNDRRIPASGIVALVMLSLGSMMIAGGMAWRDLQTLTSWKESQATILGRREVVKASKEDRSAAEIRKGIQSRKAITRKPEFALKYLVGDREVISSGFDTGSSINVGSQIFGEAEIDDWVVGKSITCWYDPADPAIFVVRRGFGGAILFYGLLPLPFLFFGLWLLREASNSIR
jgi:hypothetical protein